MLVCSSGEISMSLNNNKFNTRIASILKSLSVKAFNVETIQPSKNSNGFPDSSSESTFKLPMFI